MENKKLAVIGKSDVIKLYKIYGAITFEAENPEKLREAVNNIEANAENYGVILITTDLFKDERNMKKLRSLGIPVIPMPLQRSEAGTAYTNLENMVQKAVGMSLNFLK